MMTMASASLALKDSAKAYANLKQELCILTQTLIRHGPLERNT